MLARHLQTIAQGLILIALVLAVIAAALWLRPATIESRAQARVIATDRPAEGIPDSGRQRQKMVEQLTLMNRRLENIEKGLQEGKFAIQVRDAEPGAGKERKEAK